MTFEKARIHFLELRAQNAHGAPVSRDAFERQVAELTVVDTNGVTWAIHPDTGLWMYFDGTDWVEATPPIASPVAGRPAPSMPITPTGREAAPGGVLRSIPLTRSGRTWIPFALGAGILFVCAIMTIFGGLRMAGTTVSPSPTTMHVLAAAPTQVSLPSPIPMATEQPTLPPPTGTAVPVTAVVIEKRVNVRAGPGTENQIVGKIQENDHITLVGRNADATWYHVLIAGAAQPNWVFGETLSIESGDPASLPIVQP